MAPQFAHEWHSNVHVLPPGKKIEICVRRQNGRTNSYYRNDPKFSDRQVWANSADPDQTADQRPDGLPFRLHLLNALLYGKAAMSKF